MIKQKFVWDASALVSLINSSDGPAHYACSGFMRNHETDIHIFPTIAWLECQAAISRMAKKDKKIPYREMYLLDGKNIVYEITHKFIMEVSSKNLHLKFDQLRGMDLTYACVAFLENAALITRDKDFKNIQVIKIIYPEELYN